MSTERARSGKRNVAPRKAERSRGEGKHPARGSVIETFLRNVAICEDHIGGLSLAEVAKLHGVSVSTVKKVMAEWRFYIPISISEDVVDYIERELARYEVLFRKLAKIVQGSESDAEKIAGIRAQMLAMEKGVALRQATGVLPNDLGDIKTYLDFITIGRRLSEVMDRERIPIPVQGRIIDLVAGEVNDSSDNGS